MTVRRFVVTAAVDGSGDATVYSPVINGRLESIAYVKDGSNAYSDGVDFTITGETTGQGIWTEENVNASAVRHPRAATHSVAGVAALYASGGTAVGDRLTLAERVKIVVASGGASKTGKFHIVVSD